MQAPISAKTECATYLGSGLLIVMAIFHGSGVFYVTDLMASTDASPFLQSIFGPLFAHASFHLLCLAAFGLVSLSLESGRRKVLWLLAVLIFLDACLGFYLGGFIPGGLLSLAAGCFFFAGRWTQAAT